MGRTLAGPPVRSRTVVELRFAHNEADEAAIELAEVLKTNRTITKVC